MIRQTHDRRGGGSPSLVAEIMARKKISTETEAHILLKSRRRCCLCFWLDGVDEVQKGQIAHLDQNNQNAGEDNLAFLCFDHHDEYDGKTRIAKGLKETEVKSWRDELYKEMEHRFGSGRQAIRIALGEFLEEGRALDEKCHNQKEPAPEEEANDWSDRAEAIFGENLDDSYVARFRNHEGLPSGYTTLTSAPHRNLSSGIRTRLARLEQFLAELVPR